ncbi:MAG TPA: anti-sigma factor antagonist [Clostridiales bacterium]|nr:anti-sigma factor antagonist [Clostridiales bacterium]
MNTFQATQTTGDGTAVVSLVGRLDSNTSPGFEKELQNVFDGALNLVLDCEGLEYVSSAGLRVFLTAYKKCAAASRTFQIIKVKPAVHEVMEMVGFKDIMDIE